MVKVLWSYTGTSWVSRGTKQHSGKKAAHSPLPRPLYLAAAPPFLILYQTITLFPDSPGRGNPWQTPQVPFLLLPADLSIPYLHCLLVPQVQLCIPPLPFWLLGDLVTSGHQFQILYCTSNPACSTDPSQKHRNKFNSCPLNTKEPHNQMSPSFRGASIPSQP